MKLVDNNSGNVTLKKQCFKSCILYWHLQNDLSANTDIGSHQNILVTSLRNNGRW